MLRSAGTFLALRLRRYIPDPFVFALALTLFVGLLAWSITDTTAGAVLDAWYRGFWLLLEFGMQIVLVLATGYAIALSPIAGRGIDRLAARVRRPVHVYLAVMVVGPLLTLVSWGWVVLTAVLAREMAARVKGIDYPFLTACVFISSWSWVCGLSSSIPLLLNTEGNFLIQAGLLPGTVAVEHTLGSGLNRAYFGVFMVIAPALMMLLRPRAAEAIALEEIREPTAALPTSVVEEAESARLPGRALSDRLGHGRWLTGLVAAAGLLYLARHFGARGFDIDLNVMIFLFLMTGIVLHGTPVRYVVAMRRACVNLSGIVFQYPFYAGIMGLMMFTGLGALTAQWMAAQASPASLPAIAQLVGAAVNFAIPSAGGEWAVVGPGFVETANAMVASGALSAAEHQELVARVAMAVAYGETSTNLLQPFFLLIIMPVMGAGVQIQARDVMGHLLLPFVAFYALTLALVTWAPM
jgi:short-chain fatty acids transporter